MFTEMEIKEEPLDENEIQQEMFNKSEEAASLIKHQQLEINVDIKSEPPVDFDALTGEHFHIVEEQDQVITVSAADMKTQDEIQFIQKFQSSAHPSSVDTCPKCLKNFAHLSSYLDHTRRNNCLEKRKCPACPLTFIDIQSLQKHLDMHRDNLFFCSGNCGESFKTLPLCEDHEARVHKIHNPPKIRYKHFCSYCREGYKTELQLHVHWLQKDMGCGKLMQQIATALFAIASNDISNNNLHNTTSESHNKNTSSPSNVTPTALSVTKLRLKSSLPPLPANKRPLENAVNDPHDQMKRRKFMHDMKNKILMEPNQMLDIAGEMEIKEEPLDEEDIMNTTPINPEVILKTEEAEMDETKNDVNIPKSHMGMMSLLINDNKALNPQFQGKIMPLTVPHNNGSSLAKIPTPPAPPAPPAPLQMLNPSANNINNNVLLNNNLKFLPSIKTEKLNNIVMPINANNNSLKNITNLKLVRLTPAVPFSTGAAFNPTMSQSVQIIPLQQQQHQPQQQTSGNQTQADFKVIPAPKMSLQIIKLLPANSMQLVTLRNDQQQQNRQIINNFHNNVQPFNIVKLHNGQSILLGPSILQQQQQQLQQQTSTTLPNIPTFLGQSILAQSSAATLPTSQQQKTPNFPPAVNAIKSSQTTNTTIDEKPAVSFTLDSSSLPSNEFIKLHTEAMQTAEKHRIQYISKKNLIAIESLPEKKQLIDTMKQQIAKVAVGGDTSLEEPPCGSTPSPPPLLKITKDVTSTMSTPDTPPSMYLPIMSALDVELVEARYKHPNFVYRWICPYCQKDYDIKRCLKSHLTKAHNLTSRDMDKINVQVKAFRNEEIIIDPEPSHKPEEVKQNLPPTPPAEKTTEIKTKIKITGQMQAEIKSETLASDSSVEPIKMSALKTVNYTRYACEKCGRKCSSKTMLNDHISANCSREPQYPCRICPKKFYSYSTLQCHITIHTGELPHKCNYCDKRFRTRGQVTVHHRIHTGEKPFVCQVCSQRFTHRETLIAHLSRHIGMKRYKCYGCDKHFSCISALKTHRDIRPESCGKVKFNPRAIGPRVRVVRGNVIFEPQPEINPYLRSEDPSSVLAELQNQPESVN